MQKRLCMDQVAQCYVLLNNLCPSAVASTHFPNALMTQRSDNLRVIHQAQSTRRGLSCESVFFSSANFSKETFHYFRIFTVVQEEGPDELPFDKEPSPPQPEIQNSTAPPSTPEDPIEAGVTNASNWVEDIALVINQGLGVHDDMETSPNNFPLFDTPDVDTLF